MDVAVFAGIAPAGRPQLGEFLLLLRFALLLCGDDGRDQVRLAVVRQVAVRVLVDGAHRRDERKGVLGLRWQGELVEGSQRGSQWPAGRAGHASPRAVVLVLIEVQQRSIDVFPEIKVSIQNNLYQ